MCSCMIIPLILILINLFYDGHIHKSTRCSRLNTTQHSKKILNVYMTNPVVPQYCTTTAVIITIFPCVVGARSERSARDVPGHTAGRGRVPVHSRRHDRCSHRIRLTGLGGR